MSEEIFTFGERVFQDGLLYFLLRTVLLICIGKGILILIHKGLSKSPQKWRQNKVNTTSISYLEKMLTIVVYALIAMNVLSEIKPLAGAGKTILGATSVVTVLVGLAAQETFGNFIAGFSLVLTQPFRAGDLITIAEKNITGVVKEINFRHTVITSWENNTSLLIPNSTMNQVIVENFHSPNKVFSMWLSVGIAYDANVQKAKDLISEIVQAHPLFADSRSEKDIAQGVPAVLVRLTAFAPSSLTISWMISCKSKLVSGQMASDVREEILRRFQEEGIVIPYPTSTVYVSDSTQQENAHTDQM